MYYIVTSLKLMYSILKHETTNEAYNPNCGVDRMLYCNYSDDIPQKTIN